MGVVVTHMDTGHYDRQEIVQKLFVSVSRVYFVQNIIRMGQAVHSDTSSQIDRLIQVRRDKHTTLACAAPPLILYNIARAVVAHKL